MRRTHALLTVVLLLSITPIYAQRGAGARILDRPVATTYPEPTPPAVSDPVSVSTDEIPAAVTLVSGSADQSVVFGFSPQTGRYEVYGVTPLVLHLAIPKSEWSTESCIDTTYIITRTTADPKATISPIRVCPQFGGPYVSALGQAYVPERVMRDTVVYREALKTVGEIRRGEIEQKDREISSLQVQLERAQLRGQIAEIARSYQSALAQQWLANRPQQLGITCESRIQGTTLVTECR